MYSDFSSMPPDQEREFLVYEQRTRESEKTAWRIGGIVAGIYFALMIIVVLSHEKPPPLITGEDISVSGEERSVVPSEIREDMAPTPSPTPSPTEAATPSPTEAGTPSPTEGGTPSPTEGGTPSPTEGGDAPTTAPPPQPGATKASPTDLIKANQ